MTLLRRFALSGLLTLSIALGGMLSFSLPALAQADGIDTGLNKLGETIVLPDTDPRVIAARIVNVFLGFMGIVLVVLIIYAGFLYMTSGGDSEKTDRAKTLIRNAIIGLIIVVSSWAIATFVINQLINATNGDGGSGGGEVRVPGGFGGTDLSSVFQVRSITPSGSIRTRKAQVRFIFSREVNPETVTSAISVVRASDGVAVEGTVQITGAIVKFTPVAPCPEPNVDRHCFEAETEYIAKVGTSLSSADGQAISCGGFSRACETRFITGTLVDVTGPMTRVTSPYNGQNVSVNSGVRILTRLTDEDAGISHVETFVDSASIGVAAPEGDTPTTIQLEVMWDTTGVALGPHEIQSRGFDVDSGEGASNSVTVAVRPEHCFNGVLDGDETALNCGGSCSACRGDSCTQNWQCASGVCDEGICVDRPIITEISPEDGRPGTLVSISGANFGTSTGRVLFANGQEAAAPEACSAAGINTWNDRQVIVAVPERAETGPLELTNFISGLSDTTVDDFGPPLDNFIVNDTARPGLCGVDPSSAEAGQPLALLGTGLGITSDRVTFNADRHFNSFSRWRDSRIEMDTPVMTPATYSVRARSNGIDSNRVAFRISPREVSAGPIIDLITPSAAPVGEYVTLQGRNFGTRPGIVYFVNEAGASGQADTEFPAECSAGFWINNRIIVKVPRTVGLGTLVRPGPYQIYVKRQGDNQESERLPFAVNEDALKPGICAMLPSVGPVGTDVKLVGERLGTGGRVSFKGAGASRIDAGSTAWTSTQIPTKVPGGSETGSVIAEVESVATNPLEFTVRNCNEEPRICVDAGESCCRSGACSVGGVCPAVALEAEYAWRVSTGPLPMNPQVVEDCRPAPAPSGSPSPWDGRPGGDRACINSDIVVRFNTHLDSSTVRSGTTFIVRRCTAATGDPCSATEAVAAASGFPLIGPVNSTADYIIFRPQTASGLWAGNATYEVILSTGIKSDLGYSMLPKESCGSNNAYCFRFTTRDTSELCEAGSISVMPHPFTATDIGQIISYYGAARAADDMCLTLNPNTWPWTWSTNGDGRASITNSRGGASDFVLPTQTGTALAETGTMPVQIAGGMFRSDGSLVSGLADLFIRFVPPRVVAYGPNCNEACQNAAIWARFNVPMIEDIVPESVSIRRCTNENCRAFDRIITAEVTLQRSEGAAADGPINYFKAEPVTTVSGRRVTQLEPGRFYQVILKTQGANRFRSQTGLDLTPNSPDGFSWIFRVKAGENARCSVDRISVVPLSKIENVIGARQSYIGMPVSPKTACNRDGEPLVTDSSFVWQSSDENVSKFVNGSGYGLVDTNSELPLGCTDRCTLRGTSAVFGRAAACGNSKVETTDGNYCRNATGTGECAVGADDCKTIHGDVCVRLPADSSGGEECDDGLANGDPGRCSEICLWNPSGADTCGDGNLNPGEQCDAAPPAPGCSESCQLTGALGGGSVCGNGAIGDGEACDDGNRRNGDGCSSDCLHEGSGTVTSVCGNGTFEAGESCEKVAPYLPWPHAACNPSTCLKTGTSACAAPATESCCGNGTLDTGEECDTGTGLPGNGCSARCLLEGSSARYPTPSFCGDGVRGTGEASICETSGGDGLVDAVQLSEIIGTATPGAGGRMTSTLTARIDDGRGEAAHGLQCGYTEEVSCPVGSGLTDKGCCAPRPRLVTQFPAHESSGVCRNVLVYGVFDVRMDAASMPANFIVAKEVDDVSCPVGTQPISEVPYPTSGGPGAWLKNIWSRIISIFTGESLQARTWCAGQVPGRINIVPEGSGSRVSFNLERALEPNTKYKVVLRGDPNLSDSDKQGIRSELGVVVQADPLTLDSGPFTWVFTTGPRVCTVSEIQIRDTYVSSPAMFSRAEEAHIYAADVVSLETAIETPLSSVEEYQWTWEPWDSSEEDVLAVSAWLSMVEASAATITSLPKNGASSIFSGIRIMNDAINVPSTTGSVFDSSLLSTVLICEQPWPERGLAPFADMSGSLSLDRYAYDFQKGGEFYNFSSLYCKDAGEQGPAGDLPDAEVTGVPLSSLDKELGILRQYLFTFDEDKLRGDGIGIRIVKNPLHLSPTSWYASRGFKGKPEATTVDGYQALRDGSTVYIAAPNVWSSEAGPVYSNIYIVSHNPNAQAETKNIFKQFVDNFRLNINITSEARNSCIDAGTRETYRDQGRAVKCTADWECLSINENLRCASFKPKIQRDIKRLTDFQDMSSRLETAYTRDGKYPDISSGSFLQTRTNSRWPSWQAALASKLGGSMPTDPVNKFLSCGRCSDTNAPCADAADCKKPGEKCESIEGDEYKGDPATCWDEGARRFYCPRLYPGVTEAVSRVYQYRAISGGARYELGTEFEGPASNRYAPPLVQEIKTCTNTGIVCTAAEHCNVVDPTGAVISSGSCVGKGGSWLYSNVCGSSVYGSDSVCGNGVVGPGETCEIGDTRPATCTGGSGTKVQVCSDDCQGFVDAPSTICVPNLLCGNGRIDRLQCLGGAGYRYGQACDTLGSDTECRDPRDVASSAIKCMRLASTEVCDDGALNGTYGRCNRTCSGYDAYCGDNFLSPGESCDNGVANGEYWNAGRSYTLAQSCSFDCRDRAPHCGDGRITSPEQCDGNTERTESAICSTTLEPCSPSDPATCLGGTCGTGILRSCADVTVKLCSNDLNLNGLKDDSCTADAGCARSVDGTVVERGRCIEYPTAHTRVCQSPMPPGATDISIGGIVLPGLGVPLGTDISGCPTGMVLEFGRCVPGPGALIGSSVAECRWNPWTECRPVGFCGDGVMNEGEDCDDGNDSDNDSCTNVCRRNVCGDGAMQTGVEECDYGSANGSTTCRADYGSTCASCSTTCRQVASSGGYCGNEVKDGPEQCDGTDLGASTATLTCRGLGYDYANEVYCDTVGNPRLTCQAPCDSRVESGCICPPGSTGLGCFRMVSGTSCIQLNYRQRVSSENLKIIRLEDVDGPDDRDKCVAGTVRDIISCGTSCGFTGCKRCSEGGGTGNITGKVMDAVNYLFPVPAARVTLFSRGVRVSETYTNGDGDFSFDNIVTNPNCGSYRIVVDSYIDNPCTGDDSDRPSCRDTGLLGSIWVYGRELTGGSPVPWPSTRPAPDEGANGGYWPYESGTFSYETYETEGLRNKGDRRIFLLPRVPRNETLVLTTFSGSRSFGSYLLLPLENSFRQKDSFTAAYISAEGLQMDQYEYDLCTTYPHLLMPEIGYGLPDGEAPSHCVRSVYWGLQGNRDLSQVPYAQMVCQRRQGDALDVSCFDARNPLESSPQVVRYKLDAGMRYATSSWFSYFLEDHVSTDEPPSYQLFQNSLARIQVVTNERVYSITPPTASVRPAPFPVSIDTSITSRATWESGVDPRGYNQGPWCPSEFADGDRVGGLGKYWLAFQQNASTGRIQITNTLLSRGSLIPNEPYVKNGLPNALLYSDLDYGRPHFVPRACP